MSLAQQLSEFISACFTGIWIESHEHQDALAEIAGLCREQEWQLATWDIESGLGIPGQPEPETGSSDPLAAKDVFCTGSADPWCIDHCLAFLPGDFFC